MSSLSIAITVISKAHAMLTHTKFQDVDTIIFWFFK